MHFTNDVEIQSFFPKNSKDISNLETSLLELFDFSFKLFD